MLRDPELHADHRSIAHAAVEFVKARLRVLRVEINETKRAVREVTQCPQHLVVLLAHFLGRRIVTPFHAHEDAKTRDAHAVGIFEQLAKARLRGFSRHAGQVTMEIPDFSHGSRWCEIQSPKAEGRKKSEFRRTGPQAYSAFGFWLSFGLRIFVVVIIRAKRVCAGDFLP